jgi:hypothetical protein
MIAVTAAAWLLDRIRRQGALSLEDAVFEIARLFGAECVAVDETGKGSLALPVLKALRLLAGDAVVWECEEQIWRWRKGGGRHPIFH